MISGIGFSIWIEPPESVSSQYRKIISELSKKFQTEEFTPHITLLGAVKMPEKEIFSKTERLANLVKPFDVELTGEVFCHENRWSRSMIVLERKTLELMRLYDLAKEIFGIEPGDFLPHLSLMYSDNIPYELRLAAAKELRKEELQSIFTVSKLSFVQTQDTPSQWKKIQDFSLEG